MTDGEIKEIFMKEEGPSWHCQEVGLGYMEKKKELIPEKTKSVLRKLVQGHNKTWEMD